MNQIHETSFGRHRLPATAALGIALLGVTVALRSSLASDPPDEPVAFQADAEMQQSIAAWVAAEADEVRGAAFARLRTAADHAPEQMVRELVYFASQAGDVKAAMAPGVILGRLNLPQLTIIEGVLPLLEGDERLSKEAQNILSGFENRSAGRAPDFSLYRDLLTDRRSTDRELPAGLVRYLYASHPGEALRVMIRVHQFRQPAEIKPIIWAEHLVADTLWKQQYGFLPNETVEPEAATELSQLAQHEHWWVRLYAAEIMHQHPAFRNADLLDLLQADQHPLVRTTAKEAASND